MCSRWIVSGAIVLLGWFGCSEPRDFASNENGADDGSWIDVVSIAHVKSLYRGYPLRIDDEVEIRGVVTANDSYGAYRYTLVVQDETGGIEIKAGGDELYTLYPIGQEIRVRCQGLVLGDYGGVVSLGVVSEDTAYENGFIPEAERSRYLKKTGEVKFIFPDTLRIVEATADRVGTYVAFEEVQFIDAEIGLSWSEAEADTDRHLVDRSGDTLVVRTSHNADFAAWTLPEGSGYIEGILSYFNGTCQLKVVVPKNVVMESPRFGGEEVAIDSPDSPVAACSTTDP